MIKYDVVSLIIRILSSCLFIMRQNLIHTLTVLIDTDNGSQILKRDLKRLIHSGYNQQKCKERQYTDLAINQKNTSNKCYCPDTKF